MRGVISPITQRHNGVDSLVLKGVNGEVIGSVPVADFIADGMLESVTPEEGTNNFIFTFKTGNGTTESFKVDFSKYVDTYNADGETIELGANNTFKVKENVFNDTLPCHEPRLWKISRKKMTVSSTKVLRHEKRTRRRRKRKIEKGTY